MVVHLRAPVDPAPPSAELPRHAARSCASDEEGPSDVENADFLCCGLERFKRLVCVNRTRSEAVQELPVILTRAPGPPAKLGQPSAPSYPRLPGESDDDYGAFWASRLNSIYGLYHPKAIAVPVYRAPAKGKQLA
jgi:hypothetical protein